MNAVSLWVPRRPATVGRSTQVSPGARRQQGTFHVAAINAPGHGDRPRSAHDEHDIAELRRAHAAAEPAGPIVVPRNARLAELAVPPTQRRTTGLPVPGTPLGAPCSASSAQSLLRAHGLPNLAARNIAMIDAVTDLPPIVVSDLFAATRRMPVSDVSGGLRGLGTDQVIDGQLREERRIPLLRPLLAEAAGRTDVRPGTPLGPHHLHEQTDPAAAKSVKVTGDLLRMGDLLDGIAGLVDTGEDHQPGEFRQRRQLRHVNAVADYFVVSTIS
ncbi:hypothetical protein GA0115240_135234 [Streptomyces sp. DvalAA-14]|uniref:hypothetical protein n=1 Tax=unclassified Streptomyces TaxID=2593676 RepID=UPI00081B5E09|nr:MULTISPECIES: hypothetical protein [unclassified Streptomyces]SCE01059.1 hypothetical protein GA0115240_135234 [Streptomyces sp. DvalAA-14]